MEAGIEHQLKWLCQLVEAYQFHKKTATAQNECVRNEIATLSPHSILIWLDFKQNYTLPATFRETGDQFWASSRKEVTCLGFVLFAGRRDGSIAKYGIVHLSEITEHSCLVACLGLDKIKELDLQNLKELKHVSIWSDCGPHFRTAQFLSHLEQSWVLPSKITISVNFCVERHGKSEVDALFSQCNSWLARAKQDPECYITEVDELVAALKHESQKVQRLDPSGVKYIVRRWDPPEKPALYWDCEGTDLKIRKTYCTYTP